MKSDDSKSAPGGSDRRDFVKACCAVVAGGAAAAVPIAAGLNFASDPIRRSTGEESGFLKVASLNALPEDGKPRKFAVLADKSDAWNRFLNVPVGAVYLRRTGAQQVQALNVICPHAGCAVDYQPGKDSYLCPCHNSTFGLDGAIADKNSPSARALDALEVEIRNGAEIWVKFRNYRAGTADKIPLA
ncbi:MAG: Rieske (2Fe-2S) protein [Verrucomicrobia bacterium]|nr:Rieske (2Fe-2S) protein [Verrucomicrobiota bacterium]MBI3869562.1 Rieske (2Fe-2S) protein [Verrucomicrobiota bacterium]